MKSQDERRDDIDPPLRPLLDSTGGAPVPLALFDAEGRLLAASPSWRHIVAIRDDACVGKRIDQLIPELAPEILKLHRQVLSGEHLVSEDERYLDAEGMTRWLASEYRPVRSQDGKVVGYFVHGHEVTPLLEARREAQNYAERLRLALSAARAGVSEFDFAAKTMWLSPEFEEIVGVEVDFKRFARDPWYMAHPEDKPLISETVAGWEGPRHEPIDFRILLPSGEHRWVQAHAEQQLNAEGRRTKVVGLVLDIDARKRQEIALAEARRESQVNADRLSLALKAARAGVFEVSFTDQTAWCSPEFVGVIGRPLTFEEAVTDCWPMIHPDDMPWVSDLIRDWNATFTFGALEARVVLPSGEDRWVHFTGEMLLTPAGLPDKLSAFVLDVDSRKRQELALAEARRDLHANAERLKLAMDAARAGVFETNFREQTFWCSPEFEEIAGRALTFEESLGVWPMTHPDDVAVVQAAVDRSAVGEATLFQLEWRLVLPDGQVRWIDGRCTAHMGPDGVPEKLAGLILDIDARKQQELALIEAERAAQAAAEAKSQFLANMSHEIRTPMNGVLGVLHLLESERLSDEGRKLLDEARNCGRMLSQLLDDVIDFSRIEAGKLELAPEPLDAVAVIGSVLGLLRPNAEGKGLELRARAPEGEVWIKADPVRVRQALFNLIGNAVKFTSEGHVEVRLKVSDAEGGKRLRFEVEDTGVGIPEAAQGALFRRFQQADGSTSRRFGGSGLGLAITRRLAELMDGEVGFISTEGQGSTFWFEIQAETAQPQRAARQAAAPVLEGLRILLVEDNPTNRLVASKMLEALGVTVAMAEDGLAGLLAAQASRFDLILMDVQMPVMDGPEATRRIRALEGRAARTPIVGLTANAMAHQRQAYLAAGMNGVVAKPISPAALIAEIARVMDSEASDASDGAIAAA